MIQPLIQDFVRMIFNDENKQHNKLKMFVSEGIQVPDAWKYDASTINN